VCAYYCLLNCLGSKSCVVTQHWCGECESQSTCGFTPLLCLHTWTCVFYTALGHSIFILYFVLLLATASVQLNPAVFSYSLHTPSTCLYTPHYFTPLFHLCLSRNSGWRRSALFPVWAFSFLLPQILVLLLTTNSV